MLVLAWAALFLLMALFFDDWLGEQQNPNQNPQSQQVDGAQQVVLLPNRRHHYVVNGKINHHDVVFMLDTGATDVVIPQQLARSIGLQPGARQYASTANGTVTVYATRLESLEIDKIRLRDIRASINPAMDNDFVLLGMSALKQIEFTQRGETLILRQY